MLAPRKTGWIGFDFGATSVKTAQVVRKGREYQLRSAAIVPRRTRWNSASLSKEQPISSSDECAAALSLCDGFKGQDAAALLPVAICELLQMDAVATRRGGQGDELLRAIEAETHRSVSDWVLDSWPADGEGRRINVVTAPRGWSDQISADVASSGRRCRVVDALPWALVRATLLLNEVAQQPTSAALDWGYGKATLCLIHEGSPKLVRTLKDCGFQDALAAIQDGLRLTEADAEIVLIRYASNGSSDAASETAKALEKLIAKPVARLVQELRRTLNYWQTVTRGLAPQSLYLFGGGALTGVEHRLQQELGIDVQAWRLPLEDGADEGKLPPACLLGPAIGLSALAWGNP